MKKKRTPKTNSMELEYSLVDLPTAQHKAGLAGLILHIQSLKARKVSMPIPEIVELRPAGVTLRFSAPQLQTLFDDLYDARKTEVEVRNKFSGKAPKRVKEIKIEENGKIRKEKRFVYDSCEPAGHPLRFYLGEADSPWLKLWRDMLWSVLRAQPKTRGDYEQRANKKSLPIAKKTWEILTRAQQKRARGDFETDAIAGPIFIGAQACNAERVPFVGRVEHNLLLHFWQWVSPVFVPRVFNSNDDFPVKRGYLLVIPEVSDLKFFTDLIRDFWGRLDSKIADYVPAQSLIDVPEEGGLEFLYQLAERRVRQQEINDALHAIELYHLERQEKVVRMLAAQRLVPDSRILDEYQRIHRGVQNPLFKSLRIRNLLAGNRWHEGAESLFSSYPIKHFVRTAESPRVYFFGLDVKAHFKGLIQELEKEGSPMTETRADVPDNALARRIYKVVGTYVRHRAGQKTGKDDSAFPKNEKGYPVYSRDYLETKEKVAKDAFLAMRARRDADFVEYFTGSICAVPHFLPEEDYLAVSQALIEDPVTVRNLAMLALSAHSWSPSAKSESSNDKD